MIYVARARGFSFYPGDLELLQGEPIERLKGKGTVIIKLDEIKSWGDTVTLAPGATKDRFKPDARTALGNAGFFKREQHQEQGRKDPQPEQEQSDKDVNDMRDDVDRALSEMGIDSDQSDEEEQVHEAQSQQLGGLNGLYVDGVYSITEPDEAELERKLDEDIQFIKANVAQYKELKKVSINGIEENLTIDNFKNSKAINIINWHKHLAEMQALRDQGHELITVNVGHEDYKDEITDAISKVASVQKVRLEIVSYGKKTESKVYLLNKDDEGFNAFTVGDSIIQEAEAMRQRAQEENKQQENEPAGDGENKEDDKKGDGSMGDKEPRVYSWSVSKSFDETVFKNKIFDPIQEGHDVIMEYTTDKGKTFRIEHIADIIKGITDPHLACEKVKAVWEQKIRETEAPKKPKEEKKTEGTPEKEETEVKLRGTYDKESGIYSVEGVFGANLIELLKDDLKTITDNPDAFKELKKCSILGQSGPLPKGVESLKEVLSSWISDMEEKQRQINAGRATGGAGGARTEGTPIGRTKPPKDEAGKPKKETNPKPNVDAFAKILAEYPGAKIICSEKGDGPLQIEYKGRRTREIEIDKNENKDTLFAKMKSAIDELVEAIGTPKKQILTVGILCKALSEYYIGHEDEFTGFTLNDEFINIAEIADQLKTEGKDYTPKDLNEAVLAKALEVVDRTYKNFKKEKDAPKKEESSEKLETPAPETPAPKTPAPEATAPKTPAPEAAAPKTPAPEAAAPETPAPEAPTPSAIIDSLVAIQTQESKAKDARKDDMTEILKEARTKAPGGAKKHQEMIKILKAKSVELSTDLLIGDDVQKTREKAEAFRKLYAKMVVYEKAISVVKDFKKKAQLTSYLESKGKGGFVENPEFEVVLSALKVLRGMSGEEIKQIQALRERVALITLLDDVTNNTPMFAPVEDVKARMVLSRREDSQTIIERFEDRSMAMDKKERQNVLRGQIRTVETERDRNIRDIQGMPDSDYPEAMKERRISEIREESAQKLEELRKGLETRRFSLREAVASASEKMQQLRASRMLDRAIQGSAYSYVLHRGENHQLIQWEDLRDALDFLGRSGERLEAELGTDEKKELSTLRGEARKEHEDAPGR